MSEMVFKAEVLFIIRAGRKHGTGHLKRSLRLMKLTDTYSACLILTDQPEEISSLDLNVPVLVLPEGKHKAIRQAVLEADPKLCVTDLRQTPDWFCHFLYKNFFPIIAWDDYGKITEFAEALICPLPHPRQNIANISAPFYMPYEENFEEKQNMPQAGSILVTFGGSDPANLGRKVTEILIKAGYAVTLVSGPLSDDAWVSNQDEISLIESPPSLVPYLSTHETIITTVGLTMMEALRLGRRVILVHPTAYHTRLGQLVEGVIDLGEGKKLKDRDLIEALNFALPERVDSERDFDFSSWWNELVNQLIVNKGAECPVCGSSRRKVWQRRENFTIFYCKDCQSNYQVLLQSDNIDYEGDYFEHRYRKAYGKSYEEDSNDIRVFARRRLKKIRKWIDKPSPLLVDIGSAMGFFAYEALNLGFEVYGVEVSDFAARYSRKHFGVNVVKDLSEIKQKIDVLTLWFTLEHFEDMADWIYNASDRIADGGMLCLGLPNGDGLTAHLNRNYYLEIRPEEHRVEPSVVGMRNLLAKLGFEILETEIFGLHPDRVGLPDKSLIRDLQRNLKLGDTFEIYARKKK